MKASLSVTAILRQREYQSNFGNGHFIRLARSGVLLLARINNEAGWKRRNFWLVRTFSYTADQFGTTKAK